MFSQTTEHDGKHMTLIGQWQDIAAYYRADNGECWQYNHCTRGWSNCGDYSEFISTFASRRRGKLFEHANAEAVAVSAPVIPASAPLRDV